MAAFEHPEANVLKQEILTVAYQPCYTLSLPETHRFPMVKYGLLHQQLLLEGLVTTQDILRPNPIKPAHVLRCHSPEYMATLEQGRWSRQEERRSGFPWSPELIRRERTIMEGTRLCGRVAASGGIALNIAGGTHHAHRSHAEGFCLYNDLVITACDLLDSGMSKVLIIDLDVHQGNGTAAMTETEPRIFTFSMHGATNYPMHKANSTHDIALPDGTGDAEYLYHLSAALETIMTAFDPDVALYQCGVDVLESDRLGKLALSLNGCASRDRIVFEACRNHGIGVACAMGGGYSANVNTIVRAHTETFRIARDVWT